ncbi:LuxR C-terminal-related transcriptional regulator [Paraconexibacter sp.]|uniref:LuxR C-terminal-related transcriptional regulator n=1 Tax=Paraconexibacter sp. TaxID=2949640 RepID=UPI003566495F
MTDSPDFTPVDPAQEIALRLGQISAIARALRSATSVGELFAQTADAACEHLGFSRAVVLAVEGTTLVADLTGQCRTPACDRLRRRLLTNPVQLRRGTREHAVVRLGNGFRRERPTTESALVDVLGVERFTLVPIVAESRTVAVLAADRAGREIDESDSAAVQAAVDIAANELARIVQRLRVGVLVDEVRHSSAALLALGREAQEGPVVLPRDHGLGPTFPRMDVPAALTSGPQVAKVLSDGETRVARLLVEGRSNREIAEVLTLSPETVKTYVTRILRKLGAANRAEAVSRFLRLTEQQ